jgi:hypothetical protein
LVYDALHHSSPTPTGETVARAKRTARADARRRHRAATEPAFDIDDGTTEATPAPRAARQPTAANPEDSQKRVGIFEALRVSIHPVRVREDLAALPALATNRALLLPILLTIVSTLAVVATRGTDAITPFLFTYFIQTPALGGVFLAGFLAPRASWLLGAIVGLVAAFAYVTILLLVPGALGPTPPATSTVQGVALYAFTLSPFMGAFFAAAAAWYRRFLRLSNPNRTRQSAAPRRGDGRSRAANSSQKAGVRR